MVVPKSTTETLAIWPALVGTPAKADRRWRDGERADGRHDADEVGHHSVDDGTAASGHQIVAGGGGEAVVAGGDVVEVAGGQRVEFRQGCGAAVENGQAVLRPS